VEGYDYDGRQLAELLIARHFPERTDRESSIIADWLRAHGAEYDRFSFSVRVGAGVTPDAAHPPGVQSSTRWSSRKRIDVLAWQGEQPSIVEVKERVVPGVLGQLRTYARLFLEERPDAPEPILIAIGRYSDDDTIRSLQAEGITVYLYEPAEPV
jgi:hypothetical protein